MEAMQPCWLMEVDIDEVACEVKGLRDTTEGE